jgi:hypothetical protein
VPYSRISDAGLKRIAKLKQLKKLDLSYTAVTDAGISALKKELPKCAITNRNPTRPDE